MASETEHTAGVDETLKPGLLKAVEVVRKFKTEFRFEPPKNRKRFDIHDVRAVVGTGLAMAIEDIEAAAGLREPWSPALARATGQSPT